LNSYQEILQKFNDIDPIAYGRSRNFINGAVTNLSPYISRGVIDTNIVLEYLVNKGFTYFQLEKFIQQLAWREYFQRVWQLKGDQINFDLKQDQQARAQTGLPLSLLDAKTEIFAVDNALNLLKLEGNMHNHMRMYTAFLTCNLAGFHWRDPARWMYYHLLDGDWASNALSWQWVAGAFSNKKYIANQDNINNYTKTVQHGSYLDCSYEALAELDTPQILIEQAEPVLNTVFPATSPLQLNPDQPLLIYNYYNLSPSWRKDERANRILLLEPSIFEQHPISKKCIDFVMDLSTNIEDLQVFVGSFNELKLAAGRSPIYYREHPLNNHYVGHQDERTWMIDDQKNAGGSFFAFWKKSERGIMKTYFGR
jgi:deoxyribodipyrimidine photo-lyase